ncbi:glutathione peroxidase [Pseudoalteromonas sp. Cnat2-41]|uniref:glutathione peroxidase n=1 Tax=Pseudoalteromonas TaxID=53246 RepID=UPI00110B6611|nr:MULTISPECIES: glutathione peroxidase [Pseudoalteromonas]MCF2861050.1 glutathione peroxidase [Pseudoalteromonas sp. CNAT2-18]MCG7556919.1 glutathione peroxidase [Pseudoalteromonas sp. CNAT2-18.1]TMO46854.1 glutathione peroxidase [Pseudoalteromonas ruthenica]TMO49167.1 glutathione peroxidase [Pseudoalteromonas ruthenica]|tara:strand:+ start:14000 stop:14482 length:483 start_codon:yes stop_codon:yes gene_type:complete
MSIYQFNAVNNRGEQVPLEQYRGKVLLIANTASKCGFTPQYQGLNALYQDFENKGLVVLAFPCNQFGAQEPGDDAQISEFCELNYGVSFPVMTKVDVNGADAHPLFSYLKQQAPGVLGSKAIKWNFTKFLVDQQGQVVKRYAPTTKPEAIRADIEQLLAP